jgi:hypothetical protein
MGNSNVFFFHFFSIWLWDWDWNLEDWDGDKVRWFGLCMAIIPCFFSFFLFLYRVDVWMCVGMEVQGLVIVGCMDMYQWMEWMDRVRVRVRVTYSFIQEEEEAEIYHKASLLHVLRIPQLGFEY